MSDPGREYFGVFLDLRDRRCLVVGGGEVAVRKVRGLVRSGASVTVVAPVIDGRIRSFSSVRVEERAYRDTDLHGVSLVICATDDGALNRTVALDARDLGLLVNVVDCPALCNFILPAVASRGPVQVAVSTGGTSPSLSRKLRDRVLKVIGPEYGELASLVGEIRREVIERVADVQARASLLSRFTEEEFLDLVRAGRTDEARRLMRGMFEEATRRTPKKPDASKPDPDIHVEEGE